MDTSRKVRLCRFSRVSSLEPSFWEGEISSKSEIRPAHAADLVRVTIRLASLTSSTRIWDI